MPNHITNRLTINGSPEEVQKILDAISSTYENGDPMYIDFNKIKPMPESLNIESGTNTDIGQALYEIVNQGMDKAQVKSWTVKHIQKILDEVNLNFTDAGIKRLIKDTELGKNLFDLGKTVHENQTQYHARDWYDWCNREWGTKWNAYDQTRDGNTITFLTAWVGVPDLLRELAIQYPEVELDYMFADEDWGNNADHYVFKGKSVEADMVSGGSPEAEAIAEELLGPRWTDEDEEEFEQ